MGKRKFEPPVRADELPGSDQTGPSRAAQPFVRLRLNTSA